MPLISGGSILHHSLRYPVEADANCGTSSIDAIQRRILTAGCVRLDDSIKMEDINESVGVWHSK